VRTRYQPQPVEFANRVIYYVGPVAIEAIKKHQSAYLMAVGGAAYLVSKAIKSAKVLGFAALKASLANQAEFILQPLANRTRLLLLLVWAICSCSPRGIWTVSPN
jgi:Fumarase C-terminus